MNLKNVYLIKDETMYYDLTIDEIITIVDAPAYKIYDIIDKSKKGASLNGWEFIWE